MISDALSTLRKIIPITIAVAGAANGPLGKFPMDYPSQRGVLFIKLETPVYHREERA